MVIFHGTGVFFWRKSRLQCVSCLDTGCWASGLDIGDTDKVSHLAMENRLETAASQLFLSTRIWYPKMWNSQIPWFPWLIILFHPFPMAMGRCLIFNKKRSPSVVCTSEKSLSANATDGIRPDMGISIKAGTFWPSQVLAIQKNFGWLWRGYSGYGSKMMQPAKWFVFLVSYSIIFYPLTIHF